MESFIEQSSIWSLINRVITPNSRESKWKDIVNVNVNVNADADHHDGEHLTLGQKVMSSRYINIKHRIVTTGFVFISRYCE